jgi:hypothetical protein
MSNMSGRNANQLRAKAPMRKMITGPRDGFTSGRAAIVSDLGLMGTSLAPWKRTRWESWLGLEDLVPSLTSDWEQVIGRVTDVEDRGHPLRMG